MSPADDRRDPSGRQRGAARAQGRTQRSATAPSQRRRGSDAPRTAAFDVLRSVDGSDAYANLVLPPLLRERRITGRDAAFATELAYGTLRLRGRYDAIIAQAADREVGSIDAPALDVLRLGVHQLLGMRVPAHAAVSETVGLAREQLGTGPSQFVNAVLRTVGRSSADEWDQRIRGGRRRRRAGPPRRRSRATRCGWCARCARRWWATAGPPTRSPRCSPPTTTLRA